MTSAHQGQAIARALALAQSLQPANPNPNPNPQAQAQQKYPEAFANLRSMGMWGASAIGQALDAADGDADRAFEILMGST